MFFFSFWENNNNNNNNRNAVSLQKNITEPFRRLRMQHLVDTRSLHFGNKTVKRYQKLHYNTNEKKKSQRQQHLSQCTWLELTLRPGFATCLSKHYKNCSAVHVRNRRWKKQKHVGIWLHVWNGNDNCNAWTDELQVPNSCKRNT